MKVSKKINGCTIELIIEKIKDYTRYTMYQVSRMVNGKKVSLYKECFSDFDIQKIIKDGYRIYDYDECDDVCLF